MQGSLLKGGAKCNWHLSGRAPIRLVGEGPGALVDGRRLEAVHLVANHAWDGDVSPPAGGEQSGGASPYYKSDPAQRFYVPAF